MFNNDFLLSMLKTVVLPLWNQFLFFSGFVDELKIQKNSIYLK